MVKVLSKKPLINTFKLRETTKAHGRNEVTNEISFKETSGSFFFSDLGTQSFNVQKKQMQEFLLCLRNCLRLGKADFREERSNVLEVAMRSSPALLVPVRPELWESNSLPSPHPHSPSCNKRSSLWGAALEGRTEFQSARYSSLWATQWDHLWEV